MNPTLIAKEDLHTLHYATQEVLADPAERNHRKFLLDEALMLGNDFKQKVKIIFKADTGVYSLETTVWAVTDSHIELKAGKDMPISCIMDVIL